MIWWIKPIRHSTPRSGVPSSIFVVFLHLMFVIYMKEHGGRDAMFLYFSPIRGGSTVAVTALGSLI